MRKKVLAEKSIKQRVKPNSNMSNSFQTETILEFQNQFSHENSHKCEKVLICKDFCRVRLPYPAPKKKRCPLASLLF